MGEGLSGEVKGLEVFHSQKQVFSAHAVAGRVLGARGKAVERTDIVPLLRELTFGCWHGEEGERRNRNLWYVLISAGEERVE